MPSTNRGQRYLALPLLGALVSSGLLLGPAGTASASTGTTTTTVGTTSSMIATDISPALKRKKERRNNRIRQAVRVARNQIGDPYSYGSAGPNSFDCSGFTSYAFDRAGINLPRTSDSQAQYVRRIPKGQLKRGDFVFYHSGGNVYHVGIYLKRKNGQRIILHSSRSGRPVQRDPMWGGNWYAGTVRVAGHR